MRQPYATTRGLSANGAQRSLPALGVPGGPLGGAAGQETGGQAGQAEQAEDPAADTRREQRLPPGQYVQSALPVLHYGPVPAWHPQSWSLRVSGATRSGHECSWTWESFRELPRREMVADFHCVTKFTVLGISWTGVASAEILRLAPPAADATHVMVWADYGYGANLPLEVFARSDTLLATQRESRELTPDQGFPVRLVVPSRYGWKSVKWVRAIEYLVGDRRGFWEERGYHNNADPWLEQRYSYQELPGEGPPL